MMNNSGRRGNLDTSSWPLSSSVVLVPSLSSWFSSCSSSSSSSSSPCYLRQPSLYPGLLRSEVDDDDVGRRSSLRWSEEESKLSADDISQRRQEDPDQMTPPPRCPTQPVINIVCTHSTCVNKPMHSTMQVQRGGHHARGRDIYTGEQTEAPKQS